MHPQLTAYDALCHAQAAEPEKVDVGSLEEALEALEEAPAARGSPRQQAVRTDNATRTPT
eukprot:3212123-Rhodomonas_salina.2